jgi:uncharacterized protein
MAVTLNDIQSSDWSLSLTPTQVVQGLADIQQCIYIILTTQKGTDPTRPNFGCGIYEYIDKPVNIALPNMKREIADAIALFERRVKIIRILHTVEAAKITFKIEWTFAGQNGETEVSYGTGT